MSDEKLAKHILEKWIAELKNKNRSMASVSSNFDELFYELWKNSVEFEVAYSLVKQAIGAHLPAAAIARNTYKACKNKTDKSEKEFIEDWKKDIEDNGWNSFYSYFDINKSDNVEEEKKYGNMSVKEYIAQRKYANQYPVLDLNKLDEQRSFDVANIGSFFDDDSTDEGSSDGK